MKHSTLLILFALLMGHVSSLKAESDCIYIGNKNFQASSGTGTGAYLYGGAVEVFPQELKPLIGCEIPSITLHQQSYLPQYIRVFIKKDLNGEELISKQITDIGKNWITVTFDEPFVITGEKLFIGYEVLATNTVLTVNTPGNSWFFRENEWVELEQNMCIYASVTGDNLPTHNITLTYCHLPAEMTTNVSTNAEFSFTNNGIQNVNSVTVDFSVEGSTLYSKTFEDLDIPYLGSKTLSVSDLKISEAGDFNSKFGITQINGVPDQNMDDNMHSSIIFARENHVPRNVLMEIFSTEQCPNCPDGHKKIESVVHGNPDIIMVGHHAGYGEDPYTVAGSVDYLWFYNDFTTYAPALMLDRTNMGIHGATGFGASASPGPVMGVTSVLESLVSKSLGKAAYVALDLETEVDENANTVAIRVSGEEVLPTLASNPRLTVFITEDSIKTTKQAGSYGEYTHNHTLREVVSGSSWGDAVNFQEGFNKEYTVELKSKWNVKNLNVVAFVSNIDPENPNNSMVYQAKQNQLYSRANGLSQTENSAIRVYSSTSEKLIRIQGEYEKLNIYSMTGQLATSAGNSQEQISSEGMMPGIYILHFTLASGKTEMKKIILK